MRAAQDVTNVCAQHAQRHCMLYVWCGLIRAASGVENSATGPQQLTFTAHVVGYPRTRKTKVAIQQA